MGHWVCYWRLHLISGLSLPLSLSLRFSFLPTMRRVALATCSCQHEFLPQHSHRIDSFCEIWTKASETMSQNKSILPLVVRYFVTSAKDLTQQLNQNRMPGERPREPCYLTYIFWVSVLSTVREEARTFLSFLRVLSIPSTNERAISTTSQHHFWHLFGINSFFYSLLSILKITTPHFKLYLKEFWNMEYGRI